MVTSRSPFIYGHRILLRLLFIVSTGFMVASCGTSAYEYRSGGGIGSDLYSPDMAQATRNLNIYFGFLCQQTYLTGYSSENGAACLRDMQAQSDWSLLVHTGFNDIDRRCDDYLAWMEKARLRRDFGLSQISALGSLTNAILLATSPESAIAIGIVGEAFGFSARLFNDVHTLSNLGIENSTIKTIVTERRLSFRQQFSNRQFRYLPDAVYMLRNYLRICMPYTITMDVNTYARAAAIGTTESIRKLDDPAQIAASLARSEPLKPQQAFGTGGGTGKGPVTGKDFDKLFVNPSKYEKADLKRIQESMCILGYSPGQVDAPTLNAVRIFEATPFSSDNFPDFRGPLSNGKLDDFEVDFLTSWGTCDTSTYRNIFERVWFELVLEDQRKLRTRGMIVLMNRSFDPDIDVNLDLNDPKLRNAIATVRANLGLTGEVQGSPDQVTQQFLRKLRNPTPVTQ